MSKAARASKYKVHAGIQISGSIIDVCFLLEDSNNWVRKPSVDFSSTRVLRKTELWKSTCFEFFISRPNSASYFEVNLSPWGAWDAYLFSDYRTPQPPESTELIHLLKLEWVDGQKLRARLKIDDLVDRGTWDCSLTAVLDFQHSEKKYFASKHAGPKPDFHLRQSFIHQRG